MKVSCTFTSDVLFFGQRELCTVCKYIFIRKTGHCLCNVISLNFVQHLTPSQLDFPAKIETSAIPS